MINFNFKPVGRSPYKHKISKHKTMQLRPTFTLRNLLPTDHAGNSKTKAARCQRCLEAVSFTFKEKREDYLTLTLHVEPFDFFLIFQFDLYNL